MALLDKLKIESRGLLLLLAATLLLAVAIPLINYYFIFPSYTQRVIEQAETNAIRLANHISRIPLGGYKKLTADNISYWTSQEVLNTAEDFNIFKMKIFDSAGTILFSTSSKDIGKSGPHDFFHNIVAKGKNFTNFVQKGAKSVARETLARDVVETYVPVMKDNKFVGAFKIYYDISEIRNKVKKTFLFSMLLPVPFITLFLALVFFTILMLEKKNREEKKIKQQLEEQKNVLVEDQKKQSELFKFVENSKRQWETTMDCISELVILTDPDFSIKRCNNALMELTGLSFRQLLGQKVKKVLPDTTLEEGDTTIGESLEYFHKPSGHWFFMSLFPVIESIDQEPGFVISMSDITSIKMMTDKLEQTNQQIFTNRNSLQHALDNIAMLIGDAIEDKEYKVHVSPLDESNKCWEALKCKEKDCLCYGIEGARCWQETGTLCYGEVQGAIGEKISTCLECEHFQNVTQDPSIFIGEQFNNLMFMLESKNQELSEAYSELEQTQAQLLQQEKMASVGQLAAGVAHEINNPVGFISSNIGSLGKYVERLSGFISFLDESLKKINDTELQAKVTTQKKKLKLDFILEDIQDLITESLDGCERVKKIVQDLKSFSRVDQAARQYADINECIDTTLIMVINELKYKAKIEKDYGTVSAIECHPQQLNQVFMNILINAAHAIEKEGIIAIKTWQDEEFVYTSIADTGSGIKPESLKHVFDPFFTTKEVGKGTGLGLSIVYDIITKNHKGDIDVTSEVGKGTTFTIKLPRT